MKTNETELLMETEMCNTLGLLRRLVLVLGQFHDWFLLRLPVKYYPERVSQKKPSVGYSWIFHYWGTPYTCMGCFSEVFWEETIFGYCFSETNILWFEYFRCCCKVKRTFGKFQLEASRAYKCKQILGLCHSPPRMENYCTCGKKNFVRKKIIHCTHECHDNYHEYLKRKCWLGGR